MKNYSQGKKNMKLKQGGLNSQSAFPLPKMKMKTKKGHKSMSFSLDKFNRGANG